MLGHIAGGRSCAFLVAPRKEVHGISSVDMRSWVKLYSDMGPEYGGPSVMLELQPADNLYLALPS